MSEAIHQTSQSRTESLTCISQNQVPHSKVKCRNTPVRTLSLIFQLASTFLNQNKSLWLSAACVLFGRKCVDHSRRVLSYKVNSGFQSTWDMQSQLFRHYELFGIRVRHFPSGLGHFTQKLCLIKWNGLESIFKTRLLRIPSRFLQ